MSTSTTELKVRDVVLPPDRVPVVAAKTLIKETLEEMTRFRLGVACVVDADGYLLGIFTDGDVRRMLLRDQKPFSALFADDVIDHANKTPTSVGADDSLADAVQLMEEKGIWDLPVRENDDKFAGLLHLHPAVKALLGV